VNGSGSEVMKARFLFDWMRRVGKLSNKNKEIDLSF
jgi:hypothetical protein